MRESLVLASPSTNVQRSEIINNVARFSTDQDPNDMLKVKHDGVEHLQETNL